MHAQRWHAASLEPDPRGPAHRAFTPLPDPSEMATLLTHLERVAQDARDEPVVVDPAGAVSYLALMRIARRLADDIASHGSSTGAILIALPAGAGYLAAVIACLALGRLAVLLDDAQPLGRITEITAATGAQLVLCAPQKGAVLEAGFTSVMIVEGGGAGDPDAPLLPTSPLTLDDPAFVLCTSGSTGRPKPIVHSQRTLYHWARTTHNALHVRPDDRALSLSSPGSLGGFSALLSYPLAGASLQSFDLKAAGFSGLFVTLQEQPVSILRAAPSTLRALCQLENVQAAFAGLRVVQSYGEPLTRTDVDLLRSVVGPDCLLRTTYASTECSGMSWFAQPDDPPRGPYAPAGRLMPDTEAALVDELGRDVVEGEAGELWIRSPYNALGELCEGRLTHGGLEPDPLEPQARIFRTGDWARIDPNGVWYVAGRKDRMIKVNGQRLAPEEIEARLRSDPEVRRAEVVTAPGPPPQLIAFVLAASQDGPDLVERLRERLRQTLPAYMMPSRILLLDAIPALPSGKVDTQALLHEAERQS